MTSAMTIVVVVIFAIAFHCQWVYCSAVLSYTIDEELAVGTRVANIRRDAVWLANGRSPEVFNALRFTILRLSSVATSYFTVDEVSGEIRTAEIIDRESICSSKSTAPCVLRIDIGVHPASYFEIIRAEVTVLDVNDNAPVFASGNSYQLTVVESSPVGSFFSVPGATDADSGDNGKVEYQLREEGNEEGNFRLVVGRNRRSASEVDDVKLKLVRPLDREHRAGYQLTVLASDRGHATRKTSTLTVDVTVGDVNDNAPRFERQSYEISVLEDAPIGTTLVRMKAADPDSGENAQVRYRFSTRSQSTYGDVFAIDPTTGDVVLLQSLAYGPGDPLTAYQLSVVAEDGGPFPTPAHAALVVKVIDVNDHSPRIAIDAPVANVDASSAGSGGATQPEVAENSPEGTFVAHVTATDADTGANGIVRCDLVHPPPADRPHDFRLVQVYEGEYQLLTAREFDREISARQFAAIRCSDGGTPPRSTTRNVTVVITDQNDNVPTFTMEIYEATVAENSPWGTVVTRLTASDPDVGDNGRVTFLLDRRDATGSASGRRFHVDPDTGVVTTLAGLDREATDEIEFAVLASDAGNTIGGGRQMARALVRVHVADVDDESPTFVRNDYAFSVSENLAVGTKVGHVSAVDLDSAPYNAFSYRLRDAVTEVDAAYFRLDPETGLITTAAVFDRERRATYRFSVVAQSDTVRARVDVTSVTVRVTDVNDNQPTFIFPNDVNNTVVVPLTSGRVAFTTGGHIAVAQCEATDADEGPNARLSYDIVDDESHPGTFRIDRRSGRVTLLADNIRLRSGNVTFSLLIRVSDDGSPSLSTARTLNVVLFDDGKLDDIDHAAWMKSLASNSYEGSRDDRYWLVTLALHIFHYLFVKCSFVAGARTSGTLFHHHQCAHDSDSRVQVAQPL
jgi:protocadherin delta 1